MVGEFISLAKSLNKKVLFDIDDLVIDTKYTNTIKYLDTMNSDERRLYDDGVMRMGRTLKLCDAAITTTQRLAEELSHYVADVFINRNTASEIMCKLSEEAIENKKSSEYIRIGYFSGSLTHNDDFRMILPAIRNILENHKNVQLHIVGDLDLPTELLDLKEQIIAHPFVDWKELPKLISEIDINLAPIENSIFNEAKSENKWVEAALVKVPTIASNVGAFKNMITHNETGILCETEKEWEEGLINLISNKDQRERIANNAYCYCKKHCVTIYTGRPLAAFIRKYTTPNIAFVLPSMKISGGIMVALKHALLLQEAGQDVILLNVDYKTKWYENDGRRIPVIGQNLQMLEGRFDKVVATMWTTVKFLEEYANIEKRFYLVQNYETDFYRPGEVLRIRANQSYHPIVPIQYITISKWCKHWLEEEYGHPTSYAPNGIEKKQFQHFKRDFNRKIRILIEGDCGVHYKNVDESFKIVDKLDPDKFEIWYMSYNSNPKTYYRVDRFLHQIPYSEVPEVYRQCHILLKTSYLESFSYPPLEMMATGGYAVVVPNGGNEEYLVDNYNCLLYPCGEIDKAIEAINQLCSDETLRDKLYEGGIKTAEERNWETIKNEVIALYLGN